MTLRWGRNSVIDRQLVEATLQRVRAGELSPSEAATALLETNRQTSNVGADGESLSSLVARLGTPPCDVLDAWCQQVGSIVARHHRQTGRTLPAIDLAEWSLEDDGTLAWRGLRDSLLQGPAQKVSKKPADEASEADEEDEEDEACEAIRRYVQSFRELLSEPDASLPHTQHDEPSSPVERAGSMIKTVDEPPPQMKFEVDHPVTRHRGSAPRDRAGIELHDRPVSMGPRRRSPVWKRPIAIAIFGLLLVLSAAFVVATLYRAESPGSDPPAEDGSHANIDTARRPIAMPPESSSVSSRSKRALPSPSPPEQTNAAPDTTELESFDSALDLEAEAIHDRPSDVDAIATPSDLADEIPRSIDPGQPAESDSQSPTQSNAAPDVHSQSTPAPDWGPPPRDKSAVDDPRSQPAALSRSNDAVALPSPDVADRSPCPLFETALSGPRLEFPMESSLTLGSAIESSRWPVIDTEQGVSVGTIFSNAEGTWFQWNGGAPESTAWRDLAHGRIRSLEGTTVYFRSTVQADSWPIQLDRADATASWRMTQAILPGVTRGAISLVTPKSLKVQWLQEWDPMNVRRGQASLLITPHEGDDIALGMRFDIRCSRTVSCRVRFACRLDSTMPWQATSMPELDDFANRLTDQAMLVSNEATRLSKVYARADSGGRRILRVKRDRNEALAAQIREASGAVARLQSLMRVLQSQAWLSIHLWVQWPDDQQDLLVVGPSGNSGRNSD